jgi:hypothetical protein
MVCGMMDCLSSVSLAGRLGAMEVVGSQGKLYAREEAVQM